MSLWSHRLDQNSNENIVRISAMKFFVASWRLPGDLVSNIINKEAYRKPQGRYKNFQGRNPYNIFVGFLVETMTSKRHFEINWPLENQKGLILVLILVWKFPKYIIKYKIRDLLQNSFQPILPCSRAAQQRGYLINSLLWVSMTP